jgi:hypothetical protein
LAAPLPHIQPTSSDIHSTILIQNKRKWHKNVNSINTIASPLMFFLVSIVVVCKHYQPKIGKTILPWKP